MRGVESGRTIRTSRRSSVRPRSARFYVDVGWGTYGFMAGPVSGEAMADCISPRCSDPATTSQRVQAGSLRLDGDLTTAERFLDLFPLPGPALVDARMRASLTGSSAARPSRFPALRG